MKELNLFCFILNLFMAALCGALLPVIPALTRKSFLFGVRVPPSAQDSPEAKGMKRRYVVTCLIGAAAMLALSAAQYILAPDMTLLGAMYLPLLFIPIQAAAFVPNWKKAKRLKEERGWTVADTAFADTGSSHSRGTLAEMPWGWYIAGLLLVFVTAVTALIKYPSLPDVIVTHYGLNMTPNAWADKSLWWILMMPVMNLIVTASMIPVGAMFVKAKLQIDQTAPALSFAQHRMYRRKMGNAIGAVTLSMSAVFAFIGLTMLWPELLAYLWTIHLFYIPSLVWIIVVSVRCGQGGCKLKPKTTDETRAPSVSSSEGAAGRGDDRFWALGMFYHNPDDPANIIEDRFGGNIGLNFARPPVKAVTAAGLLIFVAGYAWLTVWVLSIL